MKTEISEFIEQAGSLRKGALSDEADLLLNEITLVHSTMQEAFKDLGGLSSLKGSARLEMKASTDVIEELGKRVDFTLYTPSSFSPYYWIMLHEDVEGSDEQIVIVLQGTKWEISEAWNDTQTH